MSEEFEDVRQEPDEINKVGTVLVAVIGFVGLGLGLAIAGSYWVGYTNQRRPDYGAPPPTGTLELSLVESTSRAAELRDEKQKELTSWGWVDRDAGVAHIPIDRAMDIVSEGRR